MDTNIKIDKFESKDYESLKALLLKSQLPVEDLSDTLLTHFFVIRSDSGAVIAAIGLEPYGTVGLLRSLAVDSDYRNKGLGEALVNRLEKYARESGINQLVLLTTTADRYFRNLSYNEINRSDVPAVIQSTKEFSALCPESAICLFKDID